MLRQAKLGLIATVSFSLAAVMLPGRLEARGPGKGLFGQSRPDEEASGESTNGSVSEVAGESAGGAIAGTAAFSYVPAAPVSLRWSAGRSNAESFGRGDSSQVAHWGYWIGPDYWGLDSPRWYGGFPFRYANLRLRSTASFSRVRMARRWRAASR